MLRDTTTGNQSQTIEQKQKCNVLWTGIGVKCAQKEALTMDNKILDDLSDYITKARSDIRALYGGCDDILIFSTVDLFPQENYVGVYLHYSNQYGFKAMNVGYVYA